MSVIICGHEKGGVAKSSLATSIATRIISDGASAVVVDTDETASSAGWNAVRESRGVQPTVPVIQQIVTPIPAVIELATKYDGVVVDIGARDYAKLGAMARICDLWVAPTTVGQPDLASTVRLYEAISGFHSLHKNGHIPFVVVLTKVPTSRTSEEDDAREYLREMCPGIIVLETALRERKAWRDSGRLGLGVSEMPGKESMKSVDEFNDFYSEALSHQSRG